VWVAAAELVHDALDDVVEGVLARLLGDDGVEPDLQEQVAELLAQVVRVAGLDGLERLPGLLDEVAPQRLVGLLALPRALGPQAAHVVAELLEWGRISH
jgi:hypothetical protein